MHDSLDEESEPICPFCGAHGNCRHLLLVVDKTFRTAEGGVLMDAFNERWDTLREEGGDDFDEYAPFNDLLDEVDSLADESTEYDFEGGPGRSSAYVIYYINSETKAKEASARFAIEAS